MKYILTIAMVTFFFFKGDAKNLLPKIHLSLVTENSKSDKSVEATSTKNATFICGVAEALAGISSAFAAEASGQSWCMSVLTSGGLGQCLDFFTLQRQTMVRDIISNYQDCVQTFI
jgi:hypothetical protein